jgi:hypothetical protein
MNFLQLTQTVKRESGLSGVAPASYLSATGDDARLFSWVNWAARDITLQREDWRWRRGTTTATTSTQANSAFALGLTDFASWKDATRFYKPSAYRVSDGPGSEHELLWMDYDQFRKQFLIGTQTASSAQNWTISPSDELLLGPAPDTLHFIRADYIKDYVDMAADTDVPALPTRFHMLIVWRALMEYGGYDAASEVYQRAEKNYTATWTQLVQSQLEAPKILAKALA